eukprot:GHVS01007864.1.p1 GENE.GHVS01007864.1~~GHVS01007864.1.p1  ORF type:complete len:270 (+),score=43.13 GHVS01007864.1:1-810(+)
MSAAACSSRHDLAAAFVEGPYVEQLCSMRLDKVHRELSLLRSEDERLQDRLQTVAITNSSQLVAATESLAELTHKASDMAECVTDLLQRSEQLTHTSTSYHVHKSPGLLAQQQELRKLASQHKTILELLEIPQLMHTCVRNNLYDEALHLLTFAEQTLTWLNSRQASAVVLLLQQQIASERSKFERCLLRKLSGSLTLPTAVKILGYLRRLGHSDDFRLRSEYIRSRGIFVQAHKKALQSVCSSNPTQGLTAAADLLRTHVCDVGTHYR